MQRITYINKHMTHIIGSNGNNSYQYNDVPQNLGTLNLSIEFMTIHRLHRR
ncbi:8626_t:CDS:2 [Cetraspora pellucida]|uniref:8626_t:CDS:1 n=1 Tax=Cetraspora pellucida TaxID=1433469 RepID=A0A9N9GFJ5_9GLOM|nr:8626_t:CDS:2 [Cetraspora pellucida]